MNGPSREEMNAGFAATSAETAAQVAKLDAKMDRMMAEMHKALSDQLKWTVGLVCLIIALSMSMLSVMMRGYVDDAVRKAVDEKMAVQKSSHLASRAIQAQAEGENR
jgi:hypothetical protein